MLRHRWQKYYQQCDQGEDLDTHHESHHYTRLAYILGGNACTYIEATAVILLRACGFTQILNRVSHRSWVESPLRLFDFVRLASLPARHMWAVAGLFIHLERIQSGMIVTTAARISLFIILYQIAVDQ